MIDNQPTPILFGQGNIPPRGSGGGGGGGGGNPPPNPPPNSPSNRVGGALPVMQG